MNSAIRGGGAQGIGFAIPINMVKQLLPMLLRDGHVTRSALGVRINDVHELPREERQAARAAPTARRSTAPSSSTSRRAARRTRPGSQPGDIIVAFDGDGHRALVAAAVAREHAGVGRTVTLRVQREGKPFDQKVTLGQLPEQPRRGPGPR